jgi:hypothetical protein
MTFRDYPEAVGFYQAEIAALGALAGDIRIGFRYHVTDADNGQWAVKSLHFKKLVAND